MQHKNRKRRRFAILALLVVSVIAATGAYAFWTESGTGTDTAATGTTANITVNQMTNPTGLYPGGPAQTLSGNFDNPNPGPVTVSNVTATVTSTSNGGCAATNYAIAGAATIGGPVPSGVGVGSWTGFTIQMVETGLNQNSCKNATVNIAYVAS